MNGVYVGRGSAIPRQTVTALIESGMTGSLEQIVMGDEIIGMARHIVRGIRVDDETLAVDVIAEGVDSGDFLSLAHTRRHFREQMWLANLMDRRRWQQWADDGSMTMGDRAGQRMREIIAEHRAAPLSAEITSHLSDIISR